MNDNPMAVTVCSIPMNDFLCRNQKIPILYPLTILKHFWTNHENKAFFDKKL